MIPEEICLETKYEKRKMYMEMEHFQKRHEYLVCVDSDGCAMDTMDIKHFRCFGPCMVDEWGLDQWRADILARWNDINLYTMTRGINRFKGLAIALQEIHEKYCPISGLERLVEWAEHAAELSNAALERETAQRPGICLEKALHWSKAVNESITRLPEEEKKPFPGAAEGLAAAHTVADVAIVSSANRDAVEEEWARHGLMSQVDLLLAQDAGSKSHCIAELLKKGYAPDHVLMVGDAPGDQKAAEENGVWYYPILVRHEAESWAELRGTALTHLTAGTYGPYGAEKAEAFLNHLSR